MNKNGAWRKYQAPFLFWNNSVNCFEHFPTLATIEFNIEYGVNEVIRFTLYNDTARAILQR